MGRSGDNARSLDEARFGLDGSALDFTIANQANLFSTWRAIVKFDR